MKGKQRKLLYDAMQDVAELQSLKTDVTNQSADVATTAISPTTTAPNSTE